MGIKVLLNGKELTHVDSIGFSMNIDAGLDTRDLGPLRIELLRSVGQEQNSEADQTAFATMRGHGPKAHITPVQGRVELKEVSDDRLFGEWELGEVFVEALSIEDVGPNVNERIVLCANQVSYKKDSGPVTSTLDVMNP